MAKGTQDDTIHELILDRWGQARNLSRAFRKTMLTMRSRFKRVGAQLEHALQADGYQLYLEKEWAEYKAYREDWCIADDEPLVVAAVGALLPTGYFRVEAPSAYVCLYCEGIEDDYQAGCRRFADILFAELGGRPADWEDRTSDDNWGAPLWTEIPNSEDAARIALARNPRELKRVASEGFQRIFPMSDAISRAVSRFRGK
jgi:hypothetical protein